MDFKTGEKVICSYSRFEKDKIYKIISNNKREYAEKDVITKAVFTRKHNDYMIENEKGETDLVNENYLKVAK